VRRSPPDLSLALGLGDVQDRCPADDGGHRARRPARRQALSSGTPQSTASAAVGARLVRRDLAAAAAPFARSIDGHLAHHNLQTSHPYRLAERDITLSDGEGVEENARRAADMLAFRSSGYYVRSRAESVVLCPGKDRVTGDGSFECASGSGGLPLRSRGQIVLPELEGFLDAPGARAADALVDRERIP